MLRFAVRKTLLFCDSALFPRRILTILIFYFRSFPSAPRTLDFSKITKSQKHYRNCLKLEFSTRVRPRKHQNMQFHTGSVDFFDFSDTRPKGCVTSWPILSYFLGKTRGICVFRRKYVYSATSRPRISKLPANHRRHVRATALRLFPTAAAEWAKPNWIRRGTRPSIRRSGRAGVQ